MDLSCCASSDADNFPRYCDSVSNNGSGLLSLRKICLTYLEYFCIQRTIWRRRIVWSGARLVLYQKSCVEFQFCGNPRNLGSSFNDVSNAIAKKCVTHAKETASSNDVDNLKILLLVPMYIWIVIVFPRPHKEERFLFPIYPVLCFGASITIDEIFYAVESLVCKYKTITRNEKSKLLIGLSLLSPCAVMSISRSFALYHNYFAPLAIYQRLHSEISTRPNSSNTESTVFICTAGEWYRFPSSFYLPSNAQLGFLKSSFSGQLPQPFTEFGSKYESVDVQKGTFNDMNKEEMDRYVDIQQCSYVVELVPSSDAVFYDLPECLQYMDSDPSGQWRLVDSLNYIDVDATPAFHRILYVPIDREGNVVHKKYRFYAKSSG